MTKLSWQRSKGSQGFCTCPSIIKTRKIGIWKKNRLLCDYLFKKQKLIFFLAVSGSSSLMKQFVLKDHRWFFSTIFFVPLKKYRLPNWNTVNIRLFIFLTKDFYFKLFCHWQKKYVKYWLKVLKGYIWEICISLHVLFNNLILL